jgi:hypothetical protein
MAVKRDACIVNGNYLRLTKINRLRAVALTKFIGGRVHQAFGSEKHSGTTPAKGVISDAKHPKPKGTDRLSAKIVQKNPNTNIAKTPKGVILAFANLVVSTGKLQ